MRLTEQQNLIKQKVALIFGDNAHAYLFGSRADDNAKGGDIDLFIELTTAIQQPVLKTLQLNGELQQDFGCQKLIFSFMRPITRGKPSTILQKRKVFYYERQPATFFAMPTISCQRSLTFTAR
jgi:predicted nucleotidyltransferase